MSERDPLLLLDDVVTSIGKIKRYTEGRNLADFKADDRTVDAVVRNPEIIGEAVRQMPSAFKETQSKIEWHQIAGLRNRVVHDYFGIDIEMIWYIVSVDLPLLLENLLAIDGPFGSGAR